MTPVSSLGYWLTHIAPSQKLDLPTLKHYLSFSLCRKAGREEGSVWRDDINPPPTIPERGRLAPDRNRSDLATANFSMGRLFPAILCLSAGIFLWREVNFLVKATTCLPATSWLMVSQYPDFRRLYDGGGLNYTGIFLPADWQDSISLNGPTQ